MYLGGGTEGLAMLKRVLAVVGVVVLLTGAAVVAGLITPDQIAEVIAEARRMTLEWLEGWFA